MLTPLLALLFAFLNFPGSITPPPSLLLTPLPIVFLLPYSLDSPQTFLLLSFCEFGNLSIGNFINSFHHLLGNGVYDVGALAVFFH